MSSTTSAAPLANQPTRSQLVVVSTVDYRSLSDTTTEAALRTAHAAAALQPTSVSRVVTREAFPTAEDLEGEHADGPTSSTTEPTEAYGQAVGHNDDGDGPLDSFEFSFDGGGDDVHDVLTDQLDASLITHLEGGPAARARSHTSHTAGVTAEQPPPRPGAAAAPRYHGRRRPRNRNGTFQSSCSPPRRPRIVSAGSSAGSLSPQGSAPSSPVASRTDRPDQAAAEARQQQRPGKTLRYAASSVVAPGPDRADPESPQPSRASQVAAPGTGRRRARRASDSDEEYLPGSEGRQYASASSSSKSARRRQKKPPAPRRPTLSSSSDNDSDPNSSNSGSATAAMPASSRQSENTGRWTAEEHRLFLQGLERHGKGWKKIATLIKSRTVVQIRTHAQKYFQKLAKARQSGAVDGHAALGVSTAEAHDGPPGSSGRGGNMSIGTDPTSLAAAAGGMTMTTRGRRRRSAPPGGAGGGTKRRSIGNVVRSSVREGRTAKRLRASSSSAAGTGPSRGNDLGDADEELVLPAVGTMLGHYVNNPPAAAAPASQQRKGVGRERRVATRGHGTLTQAALEDAMYRMLTPADGRPTSEPAPSAVTSSATSSAQGGAADPLAIKMPSAPVPSAPYGMPGTSNVSPTGVADVAATAAAAAALPSWIDASNPTAAWYDAGDGIDTLLDDAEALGWLDDTGDPDEDYPPAVAPEPARVTSAAPGPAGADNLMGSVDSLSFLVEPTPVGSGAPGRDGAPDDDMEPNPVSAGPSAAPARSHVQIDLEPNPVSAGPAAVTVAGTVYAPPPGPALYLSATEAVEAASSAGAPDAAPSSSCAPSAPSAANLMAFPELGDMGMGDEQAFVSALLGGPSSNGLDGSGVN